MKYTKIGNKIKQYRHNLKITQQELADKVGVTWEMVSRYERGVSSPLDRIDTISKALNISPLELLQEHYKASTSFGNSVLNNVPLFTQVPKDMKFNKENTQYFYNAPLWVTKLDNNAFAIDLSTVVSNTTLIGEEGIGYVSTNLELKNSNVVMYEEKGSIFVDLYEKVNKGNIIGTIVGKEEKLIS